MNCATCNEELIADAAYCPYCGSAVPGATECTDYRYEAFISYRHLPQDRELAVRLQRSLEGFRIPKHLRQEDGRKRLGKLFRDEDELPTSSSLSAQIKDALLHSRMLIVVCSPQTNDSQWVQQEVLLFSALHGRDKVYLALVDGEPDESFPTLLRSRHMVGAGGDVSKVEEEPLAADFRNANRAKFNAERLRIAAPLIGCGFDDLRQRMRARQTRLAVGIAAGIAAVSLAFGSFSLYQQMEIQENQRAAQKNESELLAVQAQELLARGDRVEAVKTAMSALPESATDTSRPFVPAAFMALQQAVELYPTAGDWSPVFSISQNTDTFCETSSQELLATATADESIELYSLSYGTKLQPFTREDLLGNDSEGLPLTDYTFCGPNLVCSYGNMIICVDPETRETLWNIDAPSTVTCMTGNEHTLAVVVYDITDAPRTIALLDATTGKTIVRGSFTETHASLYDLILADDGQRVACIDKASNEFAILGTDGSSATGQMAGSVCKDAFFDGERIYALSSDRSYSPGGMVYVEAFDSSMNKQWQYADTSKASFDANGSLNIVLEDIVGMHKEDSGKNELVVAFSSSLVMLDPADGTVVRHDEFREPIVACFAYEGLCFGILSNGWWFTNADEELYSEAPGAYLYEDITTGEFARARFASNGAGFFLVGKSFNPSKLTVFKLGNSEVATRMARIWKEEVVGDRDGWLPENSRTIQDNGQLACIAEDRIVFPDPESLAELGSVDKKALKQLAWDAGMGVSFAATGDAFVWGRAAKDPQSIAIYRITADHQVASSTVIENALSTDNQGSVNNRDGMNGRRLAVSPGNYVAWPAPDRAIILDANTLESVAEAPATDGYDIDAISLGTNTVLLCERKGLWLAGRYRLARIEDGKDVLSDLEKYSYRTQDGMISELLETGQYARYIPFNSAEPAVDAEGKTAVLPCADGVLRAFDLSEGRLLWESPDAPTQVEYLAILPDTGRILLQDAEGRCSLLSGDNGQTIAKTMTSLDPIQRATYSSDSDFAVEYRNGSWRKGLALISTDEENFGPIADVPKGVAFSRAGKFFLVNEGGEYSLHPPHNLDTALSFANSIIETSGNYDEMLAAQEERKAAASEGSAD